jgi:hypothetical protein
LSAVYLEIPRNVVSNFLLDYRRAPSIAFCAVEDAVLEQVDFLRVDRLVRNFPTKGSKRFVLYCGGLLLPSDAFSGFSIMLGNAGFATLVKSFVQESPSNPIAFCSGVQFPRPRRLPARLFQPWRPRPDRKPDSARFVDVRILATDEIYRSIRVGDS